MDGYGTSRWTCGVCGESYEASGVVGDLKVERWALDHRRMHRAVDMAPTSLPSPEDVHGILRGYERRDD